MNPQSFIALDFAVALKYCDLDFDVESVLKEDNAHLIPMFLPKGPIGRTEISLLIEELLSNPKLNNWVTLGLLGEAYLKAALAQKAFTDRAFNVPLSPAVYPISMDAAKIFKFYLKLVDYLTFEPFKEEISNPDVQKEKERAEGLIAKMAGQSSTLITLDQLLEEYLVRRFEEKYSAIEGQLNEWYKIPTNASAIQLDETLNLQNLTNAIGTRWDDFKAFILNSSIKRAVKRMKDAAFREELFNDYLTNKCQELSLTSLKRDLNSFQQMLRISRKIGMTEEDCLLYEWKYKPLENMPDELASDIDADLIESEEVLKKRLWKDVAEIEKYFILSPYTKKGSEFRILMAMSLLDDIFD